jgi:AcrR family transcriptional regulator
VEEEKMDRRSQRTRQLLMQALLELVCTENYDKITIQDIVDHANVGRSTFYVHFQDKNDLLRSGFGHVLDTTVQQIKLDHEGQLIFDTAVLFQHATGHYEVYKTLIWGSGHDVMISDGHEMLSLKIEDRLALLLPEDYLPPVPLTIVAYSVAGTLLLLLKWWLDNKMPHPPERMNAIFQQLVMPGIRECFVFNRG